MGEGGRPRGSLARALRRTAGASLALALLLRLLVVEPFEVQGAGMAPSLLPGDVVLVSRLAYRLRLPPVERPLVELASPRRGDLVVFEDPRSPGRRLVRRVVGLPGDVIELRGQVLHLNGVAQPRLEAGLFCYLEPAAGEEPAQWDTCRQVREVLGVGPTPVATSTPTSTPTSAAALAEPARPSGGRAGVREDAPPAVTPSDLPAGASTHLLLQCRRARPGRNEGPFGPVRPGHLFVLADNRDRADDSRAGWEVPEGAVVGRAAAVLWSWGAGGWSPSGETGLRLERLFKPAE